MRREVKMIYPGSFSSYGADAPFFAELQRQREAAERVMPVVDDLQDRKLREYGGILVGNNVQDPLYNLINDGESPTSVIVQDYVGKGFDPENAGQRARYLSALSRLTGQGVSQ